MKTDFYQSKMLDEPNSKAFDAELVSDSSARSQENEDLDLAIIDHISSASALVFPIQRLIGMSKIKATPSIIIFGNFKN